MKTLPILATLCLSFAAPELAAETGCPIRPLAPDYVAFDNSKDEKNIPLYTPSILALTGGRLVAASERGGGWGRDHGWNAHISTSDDGGKTWTERARAKMTHGRVFQAGKSLYYLGHEKDLQIMRSDDSGETWSKPVKLTKGQKWHQSACNVWHAKGNVYLVMERRVPSKIKGWEIGNIAPVLMRGKETDDLTKRENWTFASELVFEDILPGYKDNQFAQAGFGVPFYPQTYPKPYEVTPDRKAHPIGWLESNVVQITDPKHYWYDPSGNTFHLFMRAHTGGTGYAAMAKVVEQKDGTMVTTLQTAPSGMVMLYLPFPGGQMRFHVLYDQKTKLYWLLSSQATDSMTRADELPDDRYQLPFNERQRLVLHFSKNMVDWCFAGLVDKVSHNRASRHYASMDIDGDDLVILSRSGDERSHSAHNGNLVTFHRVKNFRDLVY